MSTSALRLPTLEGLDVAGKRVLLRADLNVPLDDGNVGDDFRIRSSLPAIERLRDRGAEVVVCSHLGRPKGPDPSLSMAPVTARLGELGGFPTVQLSGVAGPEVAAELADVAAGAVAVLENTRFDPGEKANSPELSHHLAELADVFVLDAFGSAHRAHASTVGVAQILPSAAGPLLQAEVEALGALLHDPVRPYVVVLGGAKVSDKLGVMQHLLPRVDAMLVGGGMCFTLFAAQGHGIGDSLLDEERIDDVAALLEEYSDKVVLPSDVVVADRFAEDAPGTVVAATDIPDGTVGLDIGPASIDEFSAVIEGAASVFWNGPMGVFEWEAYRRGTAGVAEAVAACTGFSVVGGGDSVAAIRMLGKDDEVGHVSTGGGAGLEMLEGKTLPGVAALQAWSQ